MKTDVARALALLVIITSIGGILYFAGGFIYSLLGKIYGAPEDIQIVQCGFIEEEFKKLQESFAQMSRTCSDLSQTNY